MDRDLDCLLERSCAKIQADVPQQQKTTLGATSVSMNKINKLRLKVPVKLGLTNIQQMSDAASQDRQKDLMECLPPLVYFKPRIKSVLLSTRGLVGFPTHNPSWRTRLRGY